MQIPFPGKASRVLCYAVIVIVMAAGCGPKALPVPKIEPDAIVQRIMEEYDKNGDGKLDEAELEKCPALKYAVTRIVGPDKNYLTVEDLTERLNKFQASHVGITSARCMVTRGGKGVKDVTVTYIPEKFMGDAIKPGSGVTDERGVAEIKIEGMPLPGLHVGYYRVEVSMKDEEGNELLPARYNKDSKYGQEIAPDRMITLGISFDSQ